MNVEGRFVQIDRTGNRRCFRMRAIIITRNPCLKGAYDMVEMKREQRLIPSYVPSEPNTLPFFLEKKPEELPVDFFISHITATFLQTLTWWAETKFLSSPKTITQYFYLTV